MTTITQLDQLPLAFAERFNARAFATGQTGLVMADWSLSGTGPDGSPVSLGGSTADVAVFDGATGWRYLIDNPFGTV